jgi:FkbM family methyltransferase
MTGQNKRSTGKLELIQKPLRPLRSISRFFKDQQQRGEHLFAYFRGREVWIRPAIRAKRLRLGTRDGEWCICPDSLHQGSTVYSFGVGKDISFDRALIERFGAEIHAFDPTPISAKWIRRQPVEPRFHFHPYGIAGYDGVAEFALPLSHGVSFTLLPDVPSKRTAHGEVYRLATIFEKLGHKRIDLLKLDIEGAEYEVIPQVIAAADRIDQLLVEFHHRLIPGGEGLERTRMALGLLAANGFALFNVSPRGLEYSFLRRP